MYSRRDERIGQTGNGGIAFSLHDEKMRIRPHSETIYRYARDVELKMQCTFNEISL
jgi:hypothetical protein